MPGSRLAYQIVGQLNSRHNVKIRVLSWRSDGDSGSWVILDHQGLERKLIPSDELVEWADLLVVACLGAGSLSKMLQGDTDGFLLEVLRSWDVSKKILLVPSMSFAMWENPMTRKQITKIRRKWNWIHVFEPVLWHGRDNSLNVSRNWTGMEELIQGIHNQADLISIGHDLEMTPNNLQQSSQAAVPCQAKLPPEIWSLVLEFVGDWEVATSLGVYTSLPMPLEWRSHQTKASSASADQQGASNLEWVMLVGSYQQIVDWFKLYPAPKWLSKLCVKLIIKFARTDLLSYFEACHKDLFWSTFGHTLLPTKASFPFGKTEILSWWNTSPSFLIKEYSSEALDSASKACFIHILEWWRNSGLPLRYTEAALEQASSRGHIEVLQWWRGASLPQDEEDYIDGDDPSDAALSQGKFDQTALATLNTSHLRLKVGKSIIHAAQNGQAATLEWWVNSGIPTAHEESVARIASANGHVNILQLWKECKGEKMQYDNQVLVGPTKNGHVEVLEWWKRSEYVVEYKTCDIEEALEDSLGGSGEDRIRAWWARNGLNLGVGTSEWMKVKVL
ncbi:hypothetical protein MMC28_001133 [Mycoblastus sanguinarius]|nr:hypothetical protein [Mycoblastus sanguinarius]